MDQGEFEAAVRQYWTVREGQARRQRESGRADAGLRGAVTGGAHMDAMAELAIGNATDIWTAYREGLFGTVRPWLGYLFLLEEAPGSIKPVRVKQPFFEVDSVFLGASYKKRYEILCRRLIRERLYDAACFVTASADLGSPIHEPASDLSFLAFANAIRARAAGLLYTK
ncbi:MAG TPA: PaeR7I family type II restriction endonuclease [Solirubrobacteraceae bacterium]|jgi:hypothetical protein|nr:PaeR7I family type II restriction endonuclease [Solirubrobacteraceae bacterium]